MTRTLKSDNKVVRIHNDVDDGVLKRGEIGCLSELVHRGTPEERTFSCRAERNDRPPEKEDG